MFSDDRRGLVFPMVLGGLLADSEHYHRSWLDFNKKVLEIFLGGRVGLQMGADGTQMAG